MPEKDVDPDCVELARKFLADVTVAEAPSEKQIAADTQSLSEAIQEAIEDWFIARPSPVSECTCRYVGLGGNDPDGYVKRDRWCPVHGEDPDRAREDRAERERKL